MTSVAAFCSSLQQTFEAHADAHKARGAAAYMRNQFAFIGIDSPTRRRLLRSVESSIGLPSNVLALVSTLWDRSEREYQYAACDILRRPKVAAMLTPTDIPSVRQLITAKSWWDTIDVLSPKVAGAILRPFPKRLETVAQEWVEHDDFWLQRSAILIQLDSKENTNAELLFQLILRRADSHEFFVRKGAGWALRQYSRVNPTRVRAFINEYENVLSALTVREGSKYC